MPSLEPVTLARLVSAGTAPLREHTVLHHRAPLIVDPTGASDREVDDAVSILGEVPTVTILRGRPDEVPAALADAVDLCLTDEPDPPRPWVTATVDGCAEAVGSHPEAALALVSLTRTTRHAPVLEAIAAEAATYGMLLGSADHRRWLASREPTAARPGDDRRVQVERHDDRLTILLDRPEARNAIDSATRDALVEALELVAADPSITAVTLAGSGPAFCAGGDLREFGAVGDGATAFAVRLAVHPGAALHRVAERVCARLHGPCVGAGIEIPAFATEVVAAPDTTVRLPELAMGLVPGAGGTVSIPRRIGRQRANWLALTGASIDARTALAWGLVDRVPAHDR